MRSLLYLLLPLLVSTTTFGQKLHWSIPIPHPDNDFETSRISDFRYDGGGGAVFTVLYIKNANIIAVRLFWVNRAKRLDFVDFQIPSPLPDGKIWTDFAPSIFRVTPTRLTTIVRVDDTTKGFVQYRRKGKQLITTATSFDLGADNEGLVLNRVTPLFPPSAFDPAGATRPDTTGFYMIEEDAELGNPVAIRRYKD